MYYIWCSFAKGRFDQLYALFVHVHKSVNLMFIIWTWCAFGTLKQYTKILWLHAKTVLFIWRHSFICYLQQISICHAKRQIHFKLNNVLMTVTGLMARLVSWTVIDSLMFNFSQNFTTTKHVNVCIIKARILISTEHSSANCNKTIFICWELIGR